MKKNKKSSWLFVLGFIVVLGIMFLSNALKEKLLLLEVPDNAGVTLLETVDESLVCVFQDGQVVSWQWDVLPQKAGSFKALSDQVITLDFHQMAAVNKTGKKVLTVHEIPNGQKQKEMSVGWEDQDVWLRISPDKKLVALIRRNAPDTQGSVLYELLNVDLEKEILGSPATLSIFQETEDIIDYALDNTGVIFAVGSKADTGRIAAANLQQGSILWDQSFEGTKEFCSVAASPDSTAIYAGNRDGLLYKINAKTGGIIKEVKLLKDGETRPVTNDYSVLNLAFSPDGTYYVATINPKAYIVNSDSDEVFHTFSPADRLVSKIAFSPDNKFIATSDIRAGWPIKIWPMPEEE